MRKRKTLPKDFGELLTTSSLADLQAIFRRTELDARGGYTKKSALGFLECPDELIVWLAGEGLPVDTPDSYDETPLWTRAARGRPEQIPLLLSLGADIERQRRGGGAPLHGAAANQRPESVRTLLAHGADVHAPYHGRTTETPLLHGLRGTANASISRMAEVAELLLEAGATVTDQVREQVRRIGTDFEFHRSGFNPDYLDATDAGLHKLYRLFDTEPVPPRRTHDGVSPILLPDAPWPEQHEALWALLVPSSGPAATVQGEAIRVAGKISHEIQANGGANWDRSFRAMADALPGYLAAGTPLPEDERQEAAALVKNARAGDDDQFARLAELVVRWIGQNPDPLPLPAPAYHR